MAFLEKSGSSIVDSADVRSDFVWLKGRERIRKVPDHSYVNYSNSSEKRQICSSRLNLNVIV